MKIHIAGVASRRGLPYNFCMASIVISDIDEAIEARLSRKAAEHGTSIAEEAKAILLREFSTDLPASNLAELATTLFGEHGAVIEPHPPVMPRAAPDFSA